MLRNKADDLIERLYDAGEVYDALYGGMDRSLHLVRDRGCWTASWRNGPFDQHRHDARDTTMTAAVQRLVEWIENDNADYSQAAAQ